MNAVKRQVACDQPIQPKPESDALLGRRVTAIDPGLKWPIDLPVPLKEKMLPTFHLGWPNEIAVNLNGAFKHTSLAELPPKSNSVVFWNNGKTVRLMRQGTVRPLVSTS